MHGLRSATGFLQQKVSDRVDTRYTPKLKFVLDQGVKKAAEVTRILGELLPEGDKGQDNLSLDEALPGNETPTPVGTEDNADEPTQE